MKRKQTQINNTIAKLESVEDLEDLISINQCIFVANNLIRTQNKYLEVHYFNNNNNLGYLLNVCDGIIRENKKIESNNEYITSNQILQKLTLLKCYASSPLVSF
ncbi:MAG: hypothetical protein WCG91_01165 [Candidatus Shapirobacteria bacterium]